jgi:glutaredoxin
MLLRIARNITGYIFIFFDLLTRGKSPARTAEQQEKAQAALQGLSLYQFQACPFCTKTRRALHKLGVKIDLRDIRKNLDFREELVAGGGRVKVPCLRMETEAGVQWLYESNDIIEYLDKKVSLGLAGSSSV